MKAMMVGSLVLVVELLPLQLPAQGTLCLSNLGQPPSGSSATGVNAWLGANFQTGSDPNGYALNAIQLLMAPASGNPSGFSVSIYRPSNLPFPASVFPGSSVGSLDGPDPVAGGISTYTAAGVVLSPLSSYFVVITSATPVADGSYNWSFANPGAGTAIDRWNLGSYHYSSTDGSQWTRATGPLFQFGVFATVVPEQPTAALVGLGLVGLRFWRCKRRQGNGYLTSAGVAQ